MCDKKSPTEGIGKLDVGALAAVLLPPASDSHFKLGKFDTISRISMRGASQRSIRKWPRDRQSFPVFREHLEKFGLDMKCIRCEHACTSSVNDVLADAAPGT